jgi:hypothetical protein
VSGHKDLAFLISLEPSTIEPVPRSARQTPEDLVAVLLGRVRESAHALRYGREVFERRDDLRRALDVVRDLDTGEEHELFLESFQRIFRRDPDRLVRASYRSDLLTEWMSLLLETIGRVQREVEHTSAPASSRAAFHYDLNDDDLAILAEDHREDVDLRSRAISEAWQA